MTTTFSAQPRVSSPRFAALHALRGELARRRKLARQPQPAGVTAPPLRLLLGELRSGYESWRAWRGLADSEAAVLAESGAVMLLPGFGTHPFRMRALRRGLEAAGHRVEDWGLGWNLGGDAARLDLLCARIEAAAVRHGQPIALVGWSLGGLYAREAAEPQAVPAAKCELHVWPTENYIGINMGLLSGFGIVGAVADVEAHKGRVQTVKDLMREYLGPDVQMAELNRIGIEKTLKLSDYSIVVQPATPFNEDLKTNPELKVKVKAMNARIKAGQRLSDSKHPCYAELITTHIFYHKAMMYGSNLFTGWIYREFGDKPLATKTATGQVKNPLEDFPPKAADKIEAAKLELRDAYSKDFVEYVAKKVVP